MVRGGAHQRSAFDRVAAIAATLPGVTLGTRYDGAVVLKLHGAFMASSATHPPAEPDTLVVRTTFEERQILIDEAPDVYYVTEHHAPYPVVLARLGRLDRDMLRDVLAGAMRHTAAKKGRLPARGRHGRPR